MGFGQKDSSRFTTLSEINVTPLVDVMLVLLIVFMISAPLMQQGTQIDLPEADTGTLNQTSDQVFLSIDRHKKILIDDDPVSFSNLSETLGLLAQAKPGIQVYIQADKKLPYGVIAELIAEVKKAKIQSVGLVTEGK